MIWRKCSLGRGSWGVPLLKHVYSSVFTGRQEISLCHYFKLQLGLFWGGKLSTSTLNPDFHVRKHNRKLLPLSSLASGKGLRGRNIQFLSHYLLRPLFSSFQSHSSRLQKSQRSPSRLVATIRTAFHFCSYQ